MDFFRLGKGIITQEVIIFIKLFLMSLNVFGRNNMGVNSVNRCYFQQVIFSETKKMDSLHEDTPRKKGCN